MKNLKVEQIEKIKIVNVDIVETLTDFDDYDRILYSIEYKIKNKKYVSHVWNYEIHARACGRYTHYSSIFVTGEEYDTPTDSLESFPDFLHDNIYYFLYKIEDFIFDNNIDYQVNEIDFFI